MIVNRAARSLLIAVMAAALAFFGAVLVPPSPAVADTDPADPALPATVSADPLPTVQIDGVAWKQLIVGNTVYVAGSFANARPAGAAAGTSLTPRANMLAYNLTTGNLITSFAPTFNAQVKDIALSPDGTTLYAAGNFTTVNGQTRYRVAALNLSTGQLTSFRPVLNSSAAAIGVTSSAIYIAGQFSVVDGATRTKVAAVSPTDVGSSVLPLNASIPDGSMQDMVVSPDGTSIVIGGSFTSVNGSSSPGYGLARLATATGASLSLPVNSEFRDAGDQSAVMSLEGDGTHFYGTGYHFGGGGNSEGTFSADWATGSLTWLEDCHGDTYSAYPIGNVVYQASHKHYCGNSGAFPQTDPWTLHHSTAVTNFVMGKNTADIYGYPDHPGTPRPEFLEWYPTWTPGTYTSAHQGPWNVSGNSQYVLYGGEFLRVNNKPQQGLVRFAVRSIAPNAVGPQANSAKFGLRGVSLAGGTVRVSWPGNPDPDNATVTYRLYRQSTTTPAIYTRTVTAHFWDQPTLSFTDTGQTPGSSQRYRVIATDTFGNQAISDWVTVTVSSAAAPSAYAQDVLNDGASSYWRLGESDGTSYDWAGLSDMTRQAGVGAGASGAINGDSDAASTFTGDSTGYASNADASPGRNTFSVEAWFKTTTTRGGKIVGFGNAATGDSGSYDRHVYMDNTGRITFGVYNNTTSTLRSAASYNDGQWHHVVAELSPAGMALFADGKRIAQRTDVTVGQGYNGVWRIGGDNLNGWPQQPTSSYFAGTIDEVAVYGTALPANRVAAHYVDSGRTVGGGAAAPADAYGKAVYNDDPDLYWRFSGTGSSLTDSSPYGTTGGLAGSYTRGVAGPLSGTTSSGVQFTGAGGNAYTNVSFDNPTTYALETWFKTTSNQGGKLIGFGDQQSGQSGSYDRHVYMQDNGQLVFGTWTGTTNTITTPAAYNDGSWHHVVAMQGSDGMKLYVDGALRGTNPQTAAQGYTGYWRIGGDTTWGSSSPYLNGTFGEVAVYSHVLSDSSVQSHYSLGATGTPPNAAPTAAFTSSQSKLLLSVDGTGSTDSDGTVSSYAWDFGDGKTGSGATATHTYGAGGTYTVRLTVTDDKGATDSVTHDVTVAGNAAPTAAFTTSQSKLVLSVNGSGSTDSDGTVSSYAWDFGDGKTGSGATANHTYATAGTYTVRLTVTDNDGGTDSVTHDLAMSANVGPTAAFTSTASGLALSVNGSGSTDPDGTVASYAWDFGDGTTGTGATASRTYAAGGTYTVRLTVTDDDGATGTVTHDVTVTAPANGALAGDAFGRSVTSGWGTADVGGAWTVIGTASRFAVTGGQALHTLPAGATDESRLNGVSARDVDVTASMGLDRLPTNYVWSYIGGRQTGTSSYSARVRVLSDGSVALFLARGTTALTGVVVSGLTYAPGDRLLVRFQAQGASPTTLRGKVWKAGTSEPAAWTSTTSDSTAGLQQAGVPFIQSFATSTNTAAVAVSFDDYAVKELP